MKILGLDTSGKINSVALVENSALLKEIILPVQAIPSQGLLAAIDGLLSTTGQQIEQLDGIALVTGPGSFTGLRVGVSTVKGFAWVHNKPIIGINTLDALAHRASPSLNGLICPLLDARQGEVYAAIYRRQDNEILKLSDDLLITPEKLAEMMKEKQVFFLGDGLALYQQQLQDIFGERATFADSSYYIPTAAVIAQLGQRLLEQGKGISPFELTPYYLRRPTAEVKAGG